MAEILSQAEIDALLSALSSGEVNADDIREDEQANRVRTYDFRRAMRFSKDHLRIVRRIHEHLARVLTTYLSGQLRSVVQFSVESVDQVPYEEFIRSIPIPGVAQVIAVPPLPGRIVMEFHPQIAFALLDLLMGGAVKETYKDRELTEIEQALFRRLVSVIPELVADSWKNVIHLEPKLLNMESNPQFLQLTTPNETVLVVALRTRVGAATGFVSLCIPHLTVEPVISKLSAQQLMGAVRHVGDDERVAVMVSRHVERASVEVAAVLGGTELALQDFLTLEIGDIIPLAAPIGAPIALHINEVPTYLGAVGKSHRRYAVQVVGDWKEVADTESGGEIVARGN